MEDQGTYRIGATKAQRSFMFGLSTFGTAVFGSAFAASLILMIFVRSYVLLAALAVALGMLYVLLRIPKNPRHQQLGLRVLHARRARRARRKGWSAFTPSESTPYPRPVGEMVMLGVAKIEGDPEQGILRQSPIHHEGSVFTTTLEIQGRGDGQQPAFELLADAGRLEALLTRLAQRNVPIDEISFMTRARPGLPKGYRAASLASIAENLRGTRMASNHELLLDILTATSDQYRTFVTVAMPTTELAKKIGRHEAATPERLAQEAHSQVGRLSNFLDTAGFKTVSGLGPRRLGALVRHLYAPSWDLDDLGGVDSFRDGFLPYPASSEPEMLVVPDELHDVTWYHSTARIDATDWPPEIHTTRWMQPLVMDLVPDDEPSVIRTVTTSYRLMSRAETLEETQSQIVTDAASTPDAGKVTDGSTSRQVSTGFDRINDLQNGAAGVKISTRVTCSSPSIDAAFEARTQVNERLSEMGIDDVNWLDGRQADAFVLSLPLCRGIARIRPKGPAKVLKTLVKD